MRSREADALGERLAAALEDGDAYAAHALCTPLLAQRTPFRLLDRVTVVAGQSNWQTTVALMDLLAADGREGCWVVIGGLLQQQYARRPVEASSTCRQHIIAADCWYGADILGERVPGPALVVDFEKALGLLEPWREDHNRWVRRAVGVAVHFWAKRSRGDEAFAGESQRLLDFLAPMFEEWEMDAAKGVGWALKTLGRNYPQAVAEWLLAQVGRPHRRVVLGKALTYLPAQQRDRVIGAFGP